LSSTPLNNEIRMDVTFYIIPSTKGDCRRATRFEGGGARHDHTNDQGDYHTIEKSTSRHEFNGSVVDLMVRFSLSQLISLLLNMSTSFDETSKIECANKGPYTP